MSATAASPSLTGLAPVEVAARCRHLGGLVFFDSSVPYVEAISIVAARPVEIFTGTDWDFFREKVRTWRGLVAGSIDYAGRLVFSFYEEWMVFRHADGTWRERGNLSAQLRDPLPGIAAEGPRFVPDISRTAFCDAVCRAKEYIAAGDIYQVNLAHRFSAPWSGDPWTMYEALRRVSPAPHGAYVEASDRAILSASPELFLRMNGREIVTRPIKGTRARGADPAMDAALASDLRSSRKEAAELVMITDLERSDLGQVCEFGSVEVRELAKLERFEQVFHLVSTVAGRLRREVDHVEALRACFPGGSITGAPKKRAREIIAELERRPRGLYTGAIGYFGLDGESQFNIAIRTVVCEGGAAHFHVGAGIVADSVPELEYEETLHKAAGILLAAAAMERPATT